MSASDRHTRRAAFTLLEVLVSLALAGMLTLAVLTSFLYCLRAERALANYTEMNSRARSLLELLSRDAKSATTVTDFTASRLTLTVPLNLVGGTTDVTYEYDAPAGRVTREAGGVTTVLATEVSAFTFRYLNSANAATTSLSELKQVQLSLRMLRSVAAATTSQYVISAQFTLRAKPTSH